MLTTRTKRAAAAAFLGVFGLFVAGAANAQPVYAVETIGAADARNAGYHTIGFQNTDKVIVRVPQAILTGLAYYARVELTNMRVSGGNMGLWLKNAETDGTCGTITASVPGGGSIRFSTAASNGTAAVYALSDSVATNANACMQFGLVSSQFGSSSGLGIQTTGKTMQLNVNLYDSLAGAIRANEANLLGSTTTATVATFASVVTASVTAMPTAATASVERGFAAFTGTTPNVASLATVRLLTTFRGSNTNTAASIVNKPYRTATALTSPTVTAGAVLTEAAAATLVGASTVYIKSDLGDFSVGEYKLTGTGCPAAKLGMGTGDRAGQLKATITRTGAEGTQSSTGTGATTKWTYVRDGSGAGCVLSKNVKANADLEAANPPGEYKAIKAQKYTADVLVALPKAPTLAAGKNVSNVPAGEIKRDGTTVHLPFLVIKTGYAQKVVITNRATKDAEFWMENVTGNGTGAASKVAAASPMMVGAGSTKTVAVPDLVNLGTGGTEGAGTISINSARANVDVVTVLTNNSTNSTDSLSLEPVAN